jgi:hypothetical protein
MTAILYRFYFKFALHRLFTLGKTSSIFTSCRALSNWNAYYLLNNMQTINAKKVTPSISAAAIIIAP